jgi:hypothetical protein
MEMTMKKYALPTLLAALLAGTALATAALADRGDRAGPRGMFMDMPAFADLDADADGQVTPAEIAAYRAARVTELDADADGRISLAELTAAETARGAERAQRMLAERDADGDGSLSAAEMLLPPVPEGMFARVDADGSGAISQEEADAARAQMAERRGDRMGRHGHGPMSGDHDAP